MPAVGSMMSEDLFESEEVANLVTSQGRLSRLRRMGDSVSIRRHQILLD